MLEKYRKECAYIRTLSSADAAAWVLEKYSPESDGGKVYPIVLAHRSWKKREQLILANAYLQNIPFASSRGYEDFLSFMSIPAFIRVTKDHLPDTPKDIGLVLYYLGPALRKYQRTPNDECAITEFIHDLKSRIQGKGIPYEDIIRFIR